MLLLLGLQEGEAEPKHIAGIVRGAAVDAVGIVKSTRRTEWQLAHQPELASLARERSRALARHRAQRTVDSGRALRNARRKNRKRVLSMVNDWWATRADEVAEAAARHDASQVFAGVRGMCRSLRSLPKGPVGTSQEGHRGTLGRHGPAL